MTDDAPLSEEPAPPPTARRKPRKPRSPRFAEGDGADADRNGGRRQRDEGPTVAAAFPIGGPVGSSWREEALTRAAEMQTLTLWLRRSSAEPPESADALVTSISGHLQTAKRVAGDEAGARERLAAWASGACVERAMSNLDAAEADMLRLAPGSYLRGQMPSLLAHVRRHLPTGDPRRQRMEDAARDARDRAPQDFERDAVVAAVRGASSAARRELMRVRSFRNVLLACAAILTAIAIGLAVLGWQHPTALPICFNPTGKIVCPTQESSLNGAPAPASDQDVQGQPAPVPADTARIDDVTTDTARRGDLALILFVGLVAASVAAAAALRGIRGTSTPFSLPVALAVLKLPTGALTACLGLLLMRGNFVPGLSALDSSAQILAWAVLFGYAQQLLTRLVDQRAQSVLDDVGGSVDRASTG